MTRRAQVFDGWCRRVFPWLSLRAPSCIAVSLLLAGCGARGFSIEDAAPDRSIVTGSVSTQPYVKPDATTVSDEVTIRNAVSSAIVDEIGSGGIGWANAGTGSRGAIRDVKETRDGSPLCRQFTASRESFSGVHLYQGETCLGSSQFWVMKSFGRVD